MDPPTSGSNIPHVTMMGNKLDPNVSADGHMSSGPGVGGMSEQTIKQEGAEHITGGSGGSSSGGYSGDTNVVGGVSGSSVHQEGIDHVKSNTSAPGGSGSTLEETQSSGGFINTAKSYLGMGSSTGGDNYSSTGGSQLTSDTTARGVESSSTTGGYSSTTGGPSSDPAVTGGDHQAGSNQTEVADATRNPDEYSSREQQDSQTQSNKDVLSSRDPADADDPTTTGKGQDQATDADAPTEEKKTPAKGTAQGGGRMENPDAIPTAGGERLGKKHWGESKVVPDNPKPRDEDIGGGANAGQPTKQVRDNTSKNAGGASGGPHSDSGEGVADRMKHGMHTGEKK